MDHVVYASEIVSIGGKVSLNSADRSNARPPLALQARKYNAVPSPSSVFSPPVMEIVQINEDVATTSTEKKLPAPRGKFEFTGPKPLIELDGCGFFDVFFKSHIDNPRNSISRPFVLEEYIPSDEIVDDDVERIWGPILRQPLIPLFSRTNKRPRMEI